MYDKLYKLYDALYHNEEVNYIAPISEYSENALKY